MQTTQSASIAPAVRRRRGLSHADLLVTVGCIAAMAAVALPLLAAVGDQSGETRSAANLRTLASASAAYSATFADRQVTYIPDDAGVVGGNCGTYLNTIGCPPPLILGNAPNESVWGYFLGMSGLCASAGYPGTCSNWVAYKPIEFAGANASFGAFRLTNARGFNTFVDSRFYSETFYSPNDQVARHGSASYRDEGVDFNSVDGQIHYSSYCFSPAAMYSPEVLAASGYKSPNSFATGYLSPSVSACVYPDLKTRMIEHNWNHRAPSLRNPNFAGTTPWFFNSSPAASSVSLFFDGHVGRIVTGDAIADDNAAFAASGTRLWHRGTPFGNAGYFGEVGLSSNYNSHTILTVDGILGRDILTAR